MSEYKPPKRRAKLLPECSAVPVMAIDKPITEKQLRTELKVSRDWIRRHRTELGAFQLAGPNSTRYLISKVNAFLHKFQKAQKVERLEHLNI